MKTKNIVCLIGICAILVLLSGCAGTNTVAHTPASDGHIAGFWQGLWNGMTAPIMFWWSLFDPSKGIYEIHNNGGWYNLGFLMGIAGGSGSATRSAIKRGN